MIAGQSAGPASQASMSDTAEHVSEDAPEQKEAPPPADKSHASSRKPLGSVTKVAHKPSGAKASKKGEIPAAWAPGNWNRFNRDLPHSRPRVSLTKTSKLELTKRQQWEEEKRYAPCSALLAPSPNARQ